MGSLTLLLAIAGLASLSAGGLAYGLLYGRIQQENTTDRRLEQVQGKRPAAEATQGRSLLDANRRRRGIQDSLKELEVRQKAKAKHAKAPTITMRIQQAGLTWSRRTFLLISAACCLVIFLVAFVLGAPLYVAFAFGLAGALGLPRWVVNFLRQRRMNKFVDEFANAVDVIVRGVKAGLPLNDCLRIIANESAEPVKSEFQHIVETQTMGVTLAEAVQRLPGRIPIPEANFFSIVITIQQRAGGNLAEALGNLSRVLRERRKMKGKIGAMSMEAKASAVIIGALPVVVMILVYLSSPGYIMLLFTEKVGNVILILSASWMALGIFIMRRMIRFDF